MSRISLFGFSGVWETIGKHPLEAGSAESLSLLHVSRNQFLTPCQETLIVYSSSAASLCLGLSISSIYLNCRKDEIEWKRFILKEYKQFLCYRTVQYVIVYICI